MFCAGVSVRRRAHDMLGMLQQAASAAQVPLVSWCHACNQKSGTARCAPDSVPLTPYRYFGVYFKLWPRAHRTACTNRLPRKRQRIRQQLADKSMRDAGSGGDGQVSSTALSLFYTRLRGDVHGVGNGPSKQNKNRPTPLPVACPVPHLSSLVLSIYSYGIIDYTRVQSESLAILRVWSHPLCMWTRGCSQVSHVEECSFKPVPCLCAGEGCTWSGGPWALVKHMQEAHKWPVVKGPSFFRSLAKHCPGAHKNVHFIKRIMTAGDDSYQLCSHYDAETSTFAFFALRLGNKRKHNRKMTVTVRGHGDVSYTFTGSVQTCPSTP